MSAAMTGAWRGDIDGLRAVAVLSVLLAHAGVPFLEGGFVGVDVFFVISGYLITGILVRELDKGRFSLPGFYERRIRRILPALYAMAAVTSTVSWVFLMPVDYKEYGESLAGVAIFASNFYFDVKSGYFDASSEFRPLLHTWSLGVEEQFYIVFPLLLAALYRVGQRRHILPLLACLWLLSLWSNGLAGRNGSFYLPWFRAWELLTGSLIAIALPGRGLRLPPVWRQGLGVAGLALIIWPVLSYSAQTDFPGLAALPPVLGAALLIKLGEGLNGATWVHRLLCLRPVVHVGRISYSLYLWHWPPLVFLRYLSPEPLSIGQELLAVCAAFLLAELSWRLVEQPFRRPGFLRRRTVLAGGMAVCVAAFAFGVSARVWQGMPGRLPPEVRTISSVGLDINPNRNRCSTRFFRQQDTAAPCIGGAEGVTPHFALVGDSFADAMAPGVMVAGRDLGLAGYEITAGGCYPLLGTHGAGHQCGDYFGKVATFLEAHDEITHVILIARWSSAFEASRYGLNRASGLYIMDAEHPEPSLENTREAVRDGLARFIEALGRKRIQIVAFIPEQMTDVPRAMGVARLLGREANIAVPRRIYDERQENARRALSELAETYGLDLLDMGTVMCSRDICPASRDGQPLYVDDNHVSRAVATGFGGLFVPFLEQRALSGK